MSVAAASPRPPRLSPYQRAMVLAVLDILALLLVYSFAAIAVAAHSTMAVGEVPACT